MTDKILVLQTDAAKLELVDLSGESPISSAYSYGKRVSNLYAHALSDTEGIVLSGTEQGEVNRFHVSYDHTNEREQYRILRDAGAH